MDASLRALASRSEDWRGSPLGRWEQAFGESALRSLIEGGWPEGSDEEAALGSFSSDREELFGARAQKLRLRVAPGESFEWDSRVSGDGALARHVELEVGEGAKVSIMRACSGGLFKEMWRVRLAQGARFELRLAAALGDGECCEISSWVTHAGSGAESSERAFFALGERSFGSQVARVDIERGVRDARATQMGKALHGGRHAQSYLRPWMRIGTDSVSAEHGAASGPADEAQALYLASRGIEEGRASQMLALAFARQAFEGASESRAAPLIDFLEGRS